MTCPARLAHVLQLTPVAVSATAAARPPTLEQHLRTLSQLDSDQSLPTLLLSLAASCAEIAQILRASAVAKLGSANQFGDAQLNVDVATHEAVLRHLSASGVVATASSEEDPVHIDLSASLRPNVGRERLYSVAFDPLDGSSIIDANFSVGSIFAVWEGRELLGQRVREQKAAAIALYGPRTTIIFALPAQTQQRSISSSTAATQASSVFEVTLDLDGSTWLLSRPSLRLSARSKYFAPANLRATAEDAAYRRLVQHYLDAKYTLRYSGGLVPDFYHALIKGGGVFLSPVTRASPAKLRLAYEVSALALVSLCAGGQAVDQHGKELADRTIREYDERSGLVIGSAEEVHRYKQAQQQQPQQASSHR